jgi:hypothetical protein
MTPMNDVTRILSGIEQGDPHAAAQRCADSTIAVRLRARQGKGGLHQAGPQRPAFQI